MTNTKLYRVFVRNWWRRERDRLGNVRLVPGPGRKTTIERGLTYDEAVRTCKQWNETHDPGPLSRKAEFTEQ